MIELTPDNVVDYLRRTGRLHESEPATAKMLAWGVSNVVMRISPATADDLVVKQSRRQLRTEAEWFSQLSRIWRETDILRVLSDLLPPGAVPKFLFEDRENYVLAMEAVDAEHVVWKESLLNAEIDLDVARTVAGYLAKIHRETTADAVLAQRFQDQSVFRELRVDPFYRAIAEVHPKRRSRIHEIIDDMEQHTVCLVLADFSPKNILVTDSRVTLVDFETGHYGDPAFDLGFFLSHIMLKAILHAPEYHEPFLKLAQIFWDRYIDGLATAKSIEGFALPELRRRTCSHLAACTLARIDGTSGVDYLDDSKRRIARYFGLAGVQSAGKDPVRMMRRWCELL